MTYFEGEQVTETHRKVVDSTAKVGHYCPMGCASAQLFKGNEGLQCPTCHTVFLASEPAPSARRGKKGIEE